MNNELGSSQKGARGLAYIAFSDESGPSDQTNLNRTVFLDPQRRWNIIPKVDSERNSGQGGRPGRLGGRPPPGSVRSPVRSGGFWSLLG